MKKIIALILTVLLCFSLCACAGGKTDIKNEPEFYVGEWETSHYRLTLNKGGVGRYQQKTETAGYYDLNWEIKDGVLIAQISFFGMEHKAVLELNDTATNLTVIQQGFPSYVEGEVVFYKVS